MATPPPRRDAATRTPPRGRRSSSAREIHGQTGSIKRPQTMTPQIQGTPMNSNNLHERYERRENSTFLETPWNMMSPKLGDTQQRPQRINLRDIRDRLYGQINDFDCEM